MKRYLFIHTFSFIHFVAIGQTKVDPAIFPYSMVVKLIMYKGGSSYHGTGVIVDRNNILTNAHNLIEKDSIKIISGYNNIGLPEIGSDVIFCVRNKTVFYDDNFDSSNHNLFDFAILKYDNNSLWDELMKKNNGKQFILNNIEALSGKTVHISGYPYFRFFELGKPKKAKVQYCNSTDKFELTQSGLINYKLNTRGGSSGSPIWIEKDGNLVIVGIHKSGKRMNNQGVFYTSDRLKLLQGWISKNNDIH